MTRCIKDQTKEDGSGTTDSVQDQPRKTKREEEEDDETFKQIKKVMRKEEFGGALAVQEMFRACARTPCRRWRDLAAGCDGRGMQNRSIWTGLKRRYPKFVRAASAATGLFGTECQAAAANAVSSMTSRLHGWARGQEEVSGAPEGYKHSGTQSADQMRHDCGQIDSR
jgi:hypothetical protein